jgi:hypothetical protein
LIQRFDDARSLKCFQLRIEAHAVHICDQLGSQRRTGRWSSRCGGDQGRRQVLRADALFGTEHHGSLHHIPEFADVPWPMMLMKEPQRLWLQLDGRSFELCARRVNERAREGLELAGTLA